MELSMVDGFVELVREEMETRFGQLEAKVGEYAAEIWEISYAPYYNDVCLAVLVAVRHQAERALVSIAAKSELQDQGEVSWSDFNDKIRSMKVEDAADQLNASRSNYWPVMQSLRLLANSYKHDVGERPSRCLLTHLDRELPDRQVVINPERYSPLSESSALFEHLAVQLGLPSDSGILGIVSGYVEAVRNFLSDLARDLPPVRMKPSIASMHPDSFSI